MECMLLDSEWYGLPQGRRRVYIVGINLKSSEISLSGNKFFQNIQTILRAMYIKAPPVDSCSKFMSKLVFLNCQWVDDDDDDSEVMMMMMMMIDDDDDD